MDLIKGKHVKAFALVPAAPGTCQECAVDHPPEAPHNRDSLFYQYKFYNKHGRWPTWEDALAHCEDVVKEAWRLALEQKGVSVNG